MAPQPRVHVVDRRWITPSRSTPPRNRRTQLSDWDIVMFKSYTPILLFYPNDKKDPDFMNSRVLKLALADVLIDFYPLAGRLVDVGNGRDEINNCDSGVLFQEAEYQGDLHRFRENGYLPNQMDYHRMFPIHFYSSPQDPLLAIQVTRFTDGGVALGIMILHKIADMHSACFFLDAWAKKARRTDYTKPEFQRDLVACPPDAVVTAKAIAHYREEHRIVGENDDSHVVRMDPKQQKFARISANGPMPLKSIILEFHSDGLRQCRKDAHTEEMIDCKNWLSTKEAMIAMLMRAITRCRRVASEDTEIKMIMSVNGRTKMKSVKELERYFGNWMISQTIVTTQAEVYNTTLTESAIKVRRVLGGLKASMFHQISKLYTLHEDMTVHYLTYQPNCHNQTTVNDISMLPFWRIDFGYGCPDRTRGYITFGGNGCMVVFGRRDGIKGPMYDIQLQMDTDSIGRLISDHDIQKYTKNILY